MRRQVVGGLQADLRHVAYAQQRDVRSFARHVRLAERHGVRILRHIHVKAYAHKLAVVAYDNGVVVPYGGGEQPLGVVGIGWRNHLQPRIVREHRIDGFGVLRRRVGAGADARHNGQRHFDFAAEHVVNLGGVVQNLVAAHAEEAHIHQVDHRPQSRRRRAHAGAHEAGFRDGRIADARRPEIADQSLCQAHRAAPSVLELLALAAAGDVLAHDDYRRIALKLLPQRLVHRLYV